MTIVYVFHSIALWGGIERILTDKMNWLAAQGHRVVLLTTDQGSHPLPYALDKRVIHTDLRISFHHQYRYRGLHRLYDLWCRHRTFRRRLSQQLALLQPDVLVGTTTSFAGTLTRIKQTVPLVIESHTICRQLVDGGRLRHLRRMLLLRQLRRADVLVTLTDGDAADWRQHLRNVVVIPNMVHAPNILRQAPLTAHRVLFVGRLEPQKQVHHLLAAWREVKTTHSDWTLSLYGDGILREQLKQEAASTTEGVEIHAPTSNIFDCYAEASILVLTSTYEPFGLVLAEAMLCGVPVIAYDCPYGPRAIISDGENGFLIPQSDIPSLAQRLSLLMDNEHLRRQMGRQAQSAARRYLAGEVMPLWVSLFNSLAPH